MPRNLVFVTLFAVLLLAGCLKDDGDDAVPPGQFMLPVLRADSTTGCVSYVCPLHLGDPEVARLQQEYGLQKLTNKSYVNRFVQVEGDWVVWHGNHPDTFERGDVWAMNLVTHDIYGVRVGPGHSIRPFLDDGRVVFQYDSEEYSGLLSWTVGADKVEAVEVGIEGRFWLWDLQGDWIALAVGMTTDDSVVGEWAVNVVSGEHRHLYVPEATADPARGEQVVGVDLTDYEVYFVRTRSFDPEPSYWLHRLNLSTGQEQSYKIPSESNAVFAADSHALISAFPEFLLFDSHTGTFSNSGFSQDTGQDDCTILAGVAEVNDWVALKCAESASTVFKFYNLEDGTIRSDQPPKSPSVSYASSDGTTVAYIAAKNGLDLYVKPLE